MPAPEADRAALKDEIGSEANHAALTGPATMHSFFRCVSDGLNIPFNAGAHSHIRGLSLDDVLEAQNVSQVASAMPCARASLTLRLVATDKRCSWCLAGNGRADNFPLRGGHHPVDDPGGEDCWSRSPDR